MWGRIIGTLLGLILLKIVGAVIGFYLGYKFDKRHQPKLGKQHAGLNSLFSSKRQALFFYTTFATIGRIAKANGRVSEVHIATAQSLMQQLNFNQQQTFEAQQAFREGKAPDFALEPHLAQLKSSLWGRSDLLQMFLELQIQLAYCDGELAQEERVVLSQVARCLGFSEAQLSSLIERWQHMAFDRHAPASGQSHDDALAEAYQLLGVTRHASLAEVKKAHRKLMAQHHPDKLISQGLPENMMQLAKEKTQAIQAAYDLIKAELSQ